MKKNKYTLALAKVLSETQTGILTWKIEDHPTSLPVDRSDLVSSVFEARLQPNRYVRIYEYNKRHYTDVDEYDTERRIAVEIGSETWWQFPPSPITSDLLSAVKKQIAGVDDFLDDYLR
jgi:hypothetical protein